MALLYALTMAISVHKRIGIIGDVHAEHEHLETAINHLVAAGVDTLICTGDLVDGRGDISTCVELLRAHQVITVRGNHDRWILQEKARHIPNAHLLQDLPDAVVAYLHELPTQVSLPTCRGQLLLCHGVGSNDLQKIWPGTERMPAERSDRLDTLIEQQDFHLMINGHVHYRTLIHFEQLTLLNAGTIRGDHHPGFSLVDLEEGVVRGFEVMPSAHEVKVQPLAAQASTRVFTNTQHFDDSWEPVTLYA